jgi:glycosyltransferase involved in cell wall biosynthesis
MRVLFITDGNITYESGYRIRILSEIRELAAHGVQVSVLSFLHIRLYAGEHSGGRQFCEVVKQIGGDAFLVPVFPDFRIPSLIRLVDWYRRIVLGRVLHSSDYRLIHCHGHTATYVAVDHSSHRLPVIFDMHGDVVDELELRASHRKYFPWMKKRIEGIEAENLRRSSVIISVSESLQNRWQMRNSASHPRTMIIPCAGNMQVYKYDPDKRRELRLNWGINNDEPLLVYSGAAQPYQKLDQITKIFSLLRQRRKNVRMLFLISNSNIGVLTQYIKENNFPEDSYFIESVSHNQVPGYLSAADLGFLIRDNLPLNRVASPTKFAEYLACGLPVVSSPYVDIVRDAIVRRGLGIVIDGSGTDSIRSVDEFLGNVMKERQNWILKCSNDALANYSWSVFGQKLFELYNVLQN